jgi:5-methylcytosine-specific restriction endonuclease McrA
LFDWRKPAPTNVLLPPHEFCLLKKFVAERAAFRCEYCRIAESDSNYAYHLEHIISRQHGGSDDADNLAYSCSICNWKKGSNIATILEKGGPFVPLFNPRTDDWFDHFAIENGAIGRQNFGWRRHCKIARFEFFG